MTDVSIDEASRPLGKNLRLLELIVDHIDDLIAVINGQGRRVWHGLDRLTTSDVETI